MARKDVTSREYKVMLRQERFVGDDAEVRAAIGRFLDDVRTAPARVDIPVEGEFDEVKARRLVRFFDTEQHELNAGRYIFRERVDRVSRERQVTLKFRHPDRYVAQDREMDASHGPAESKFEEDVKPPFTSVFSFSTTVEVDPDAKVAQVSEIVELFPGLKDGLEDVSEDTPLVLVRNFTARETVLVGGYILLGRRDVPAKCAFVLWHDDDDPFTPPVAVEFSFKYESTDEDYRGSVTRDAFEVIRVLHHELADWAHPDPKTKTAFVYG